MKRNRWCVSKLLVLVPLIWAGCMKKPEFVSMQDIEINGVQDKQLNANLKYKVHNPNPIDAQLKETSVSILYQEDLVGTGVGLEATVIKANADAEIPFQCNLMLDQISEKHPELLKAKETEFLVKGDAKVGVWFFTFNMKVEEPITMNVSEMVAQEASKLMSDGDLMTVSDVRVEPGRESGNDKIRMNMNVNNTYNFDYTIQKIHTDLSLSKKGETFANWNSDEAHIIKASEKTQFPIVMDVNFDELMGKQGMMDILFKGYLDIYVRGNAVIEVQGSQFEVPVEFVSKLDIGELVDSPMPDLFDSSPF